jgi:hypothetical protein
MEIDLSKEKDFDNFITEFYNKIHFEDFNSKNTKLLFLIIKMNLFEIHLSLQSKNMALFLSNLNTGNLVKIRCGFKRSLQSMAFDTFILIPYNDKQYLDEALKHVFNTYLLMAFQ